MTRARLWFRKPFFPGQTYALRASLYRHGQLTQLHAGFYPPEEAGPRPSSFVVFDGLLER